MISSLLGALALVALTVLAWRARRVLAGPDDMTRHPKGFLRRDASLEDALAVADRHLPAARAGANIRLQFGRTGCLTLLRATPRNTPPRFLARWEFWRHDEALARRLIALPGVRAETPSTDVLELWFADDYLSFRKAVSEVFSDRDIETGNMHLTWNC